MELVVEDRFPVVPVPVAERDAVRMVMEKVLVKANNGYLFVKSYILTFVYISQVFLFTYLYTCVHCPPS